MQRFRRKAALHPRLWLSLATAICACIGLLGSAAVASAATLHAPFWYLDASTDATLEIASNSSQPRTLTPVLLVDGSVAVRLATRTLEPFGTLRISLREVLASQLEGAAGSNRAKRWGDGSLPGSLWGSARLEGANFSAVHGWILTESRKQGLSINSMFAGRQRDSSSLIGMWWFPQDGAEAYWAVQNTSAEEVLVETWLYADGRRLPGNPLRLPAGTARLVSPEDLALPSAGRGLSDVGGVRFETQDGQPSLQGWTILVDAGRGFSTPLSMQAPDLALSTSAQMPGALIGRQGTAAGFPRPVTFSPRLLLTNTTEQSMLVYLKLRGGLRLSEAVNAPVLESPGVAQAAPLELAAFETRALAVEQLWTEMELQGSGAVVEGVVGMELDHTGGPGDLYAEVLTVDDSLRFAFHDPFVDLASPPVTLTAISFDLSGDQHKLLLVKNVEDRETGFNLVLYYQRLGLPQRFLLARNLGPQALAAIDLRELRDRGVSDVYGHVLPSDLRFGHVLVRAEERGVIAGDYAFSHDGSFASCLDPCDCPDWPNCPIPPEGVSGADRDPRGFLFCGDEPPSIVICTAATKVIDYSFFNIIPIVGQDHCQYQRCSATDPCREFEVTVKGSGSCKAGLRMTWDVQICNVSGQQIISCQTERSRVLLNDSPCTTASPIHQNR